MTEINEQIDAKRAAVQTELDATLKERAAAERALKAAEDNVRQRQEALRAVLEKEGKLRATIGELERTRKALEE